MFFTIAKKEFQNNLLSARFIIGFVLCLVLIPFSILINIDDYRDQMIRHKVDRDAAEKRMKEVRVYSMLRPEIVFAPEPLSLFDKGLTGQIGNKARARLYEKALLPEGELATRDNPFLASFFSVDFIDIVAVVFSLLGLLFGYDAVTREKEDGTLGLQASNSLGRATILAGKAAGILLTLLPILVFSFLLGAVILLFSGNLAFSGNDWARILGLVVLSLFYLAVFVFLGLLVSTRTRSSVTSLVLCLFLWVFFIFLIPNLAPYAAESFVGIESRDNLNRVLADIDKTVGKEIQDRIAKIPPADWSMSWYGSWRDEGRELYGLSVSYFEFNRQSVLAEVPLRLDGADKKWAPQKAYLDSLARQAGTAEKLSMASPAGLFRIATAAVCGTDRRSLEKTMNDVRRYREIFLRYLQGKNIFSSFAYITPTPPSEMKTSDQIIAARSGGALKTLSEYNAWVSRQPSWLAGFEVLRKAKVFGDRPEDYPYLDISDMPRFVQRPVSLTDGAAAAFVPILILIIAAVILFYLIYVSFVRYDVR